MFARTVGTVPYMAPEIVIPTTTKVGRAVDVWSLSICFYRMLYRRFPQKHQGATCAEVMTKIGDFPIGEIDFPLNWEEWEETNGVNLTSYKSLKSTEFTTLSLNRAATSSNLDATTSPSENSLKLAQNPNTHASTTTTTQGSTQYINLNNSPNLSPTMSNVNSPGGQTIKIKKLSNMSKTAMTSMESRNRHFVADVRRRYQNLINVMRGCLQHQDTLRWTASEIAGGIAGKCAKTSRDLLVSKEKV